MTASPGRPGPPAAHQPVSRAALVWRLGLALLCLVVLTGYVPRNFERVRHRLVTVPEAASAAGTVSVPLPDLTDAGRPAAVIVRLRAGADVRVTLSAGPQTIGVVEVPAGGEVRADLVLAAAPQPGDRLELRSDDGRWTLEYLEVANVFGFTRGLISVQVGPGGAGVPRRIPFVAALAVAVLVAAAAGGRVRRHRLRATTRALAAAAVVLFLVVVAAPWLTRYQLLLAPHTFALVAALLCLPRLAGMARRATVLFALPRPGTWHLSARLPAAIGALSMAVTGVAWVVGSHAAGGADSSGYISEAALWSQGRLRSPEPIVDLLPAGIDPAVAAPLGWVPHFAAGTPDVLVPIYSPGLPMAMAVAQRLGGPQAVYAVVPLLAGLAVWLTFVLGRRLDGPATGAIAAVWLAFSPAFLLSMLNPMSDVPVTTWWLLALVLATAGRPLTAAGAGVATAAAVLTRPNLAILAPLVAAVALLWDQAQPRGRRRCLLLFGAGVLPGALTVAALFDFWYGSPLKSGYGSLDYLFSAANLRPNLERYPRWLVESQTWLPLVAVAAPFCLPGGGGTRTPRLVARATVWVLVAFVAAVWVQYLFYAPFDSWDYLRFVLPTYPVILVLAGTVLVAALRRTAWPALLGTTLAALLAVHGYQYMERKTAFAIRPGEARYRLAGEYAANLPAGAVVISMQHSGSVRFYSGRPILRYDLVPADRLDSLIDHIEDRGRPVYLVLDDWEVAQFRTRFAGHSSRASLDWSPLAVTAGSRVSVYDAGRDRLPGPRTPVTLR